jgi:hypothetical protein
MPTIDMTDGEARKIAALAVGVVIARNSLRNVDRALYPEEYALAKAALRSADDAMVEEIRKAFSVS